MNESGSSRWTMVLALAAGLGLAACGPKTPPGKTETDLAGAYLPAPTVAVAERTTDGGVRLSGQAPAGATLRLRAPDGGGAIATADAQGRWSLTLPAEDAPHLYAMQAEVSGRIVRGEGALALMPAPGPAALVLRAGYGGLATGRGQPGRLQLVDFDYDGGGAAAGGFAPPQSVVRLTVDGGKAGVTKADAQGRFALLAVAGPVTPGPHLVRLDTPQGLSLERSVLVADVTLAPDQFFSATRAEAGWVVNWRLPGDGAQSSLVFENAVATGPMATGPIAPAAPPAPVVATPR